MRAVDLLGGLFWLAVAAVVVWEGVDLGIGAANDPDSGFVLVGAGAALALLGALLSGKALVHAGPDAAGGWRIAEPWAGTRWPKVVWVVAVLFAYAALLWPLGFLVATALFLLILFKTVEPQRWWVAAVASVTATAACWVVFRIWFGVSLPTGLLGP